MARWLYGCFKVSAILECGNPGEPPRKNPAADFVSLLLQSDSVVFMAGTRINEPRREPNSPVELDFARTSLGKLPHGWE